MNTHSSYLNSKVVRACRNSISSMMYSSDVRSWLDACAHCKMSIESHLRCSSSTIKCGSTETCINMKIKRGRSPVVSDVVVRKLQQCLSHVNGNRDTDERGTVGGCSSPPACPTPARNNCALTSAIHRKMSSLVSDRHLVVSKATLRKLTSIESMSHDKAKSRL